MTSHRFPRRAAAAALLVSALALPTSAQGFVQRAVDAGLDHETVSGLDRIGNLPPMLDWLQTGAAIGDLTGDGILDVVICGRLNGTKMFQGLGGGQFVDVTLGSGIETEEFDNCVTLGDIDADGDLDLFLGVLRNGEGARPSLNRLYRNIGGGVFEEINSALSIRGNGHTIFAKFFDADYDGDLDLYLAEFDGTPNQLHFNDGSGNFTERGVAKGVDVGGSTHVFGVVDVDRDGWLDIMLGNDWGVTTLAGMASNADDVQLRGNGDGTYTDVTAGGKFDLLDPPTLGSKTMGITFGDVNYDGFLDVFRTEIGDQLLHLNNGWPAGGPWTQAQDVYGVASPTVPNPFVHGPDGPTVGWGAKFFHANHDLWLDLFHVAGHVGAPHPRGQRNFMWQSGGPSVNFRFIDVTNGAGLYDEWDDRGLAVGDLDADGDMDLIIIPPGDPVRYFESQTVQASNGNGWLKVYADTRTSAPGGLGTVVSFTDSLGYPHILSIGSDGPTASFNEPVAHFGLGTETAVDLTVEFPSGLTRFLPGVLPNQALNVAEPEMIRLSASKLDVLELGSGRLAGGSNQAAPVDTTQLDGGSSLGFTPAPAGPGTNGGRSTRGAGSDLHLTVTALAHTQAGEVLDGDATVLIRVPGLRPLGPVRHVGGNAFQRDFQRATVAGEYRVEVSFDGWAPRIRPHVTFVGAADGPSTTVLLDPEAVRANTNDSFQVYVTPRDANGVAIGAGHEVVFEIPGEGGIRRTDLEDLGDGRYYWLFTEAPEDAGSLDVNIEVDGEAFGTLTQLESAGPIDAPSTLLYTEEPAELVATRPYQFKFAVTPFDAAGNRIGAQATISVNVIPDAGTEPAYVREDLCPIALADGTYGFVLERDPASAFGSATGSFEVFVDGVLAVSRVYAF